MGTEHFLLLNDQPVTCPKCSGRTTFDEFAEGTEMYQIHTCLNQRCCFVFKAMEDEEFGNVF